MILKKKHLSLFIFIITFSSFYSQEIFPKYEEILTFLDKEIKTSSKAGYFNLSKKSDGYFLEIKDYITNEVIVETIVWDSKNKQYVEVSLDQYLYTLEEVFTGFSKLEMQFYLKENSVNGISNMKGQELTYDFYPFYGYSNWSTDIISFYSAKSENNLKELECLARAYDHKACNYIHPGQYDSPPSFALGLKKSNYQSVEESRVVNFIESADSSLYYYDEIIKVDSNYNTYLIGNVELKRANNCMNYYLFLNSVKETALANDFLLKVNYPLPFINIAKNYLKHCSDKSMLITDGDSDTFPLWYVQAALGFKKDVVVLNSNLLGLPWYCSMVKEKHNLKSKLDLDNIFKNEISYYLIDFDSVLNTNSVSSFIDVLNKYSIKKHVGLNQKIKIGSNFSLNYQNEKLPLFISKKVLYLYEAVLLDLINNYDSKLFLTSQFKLKNYGLISNVGNKFLVFELFKDSIKDLYNEEAENILNNEIDLFNPDIISYSGDFEIAYLFRFYHYLSFLEDKGKLNKKKDLSKLLKPKLSKVKFFDVDFESLEIMSLILNEIDSTNSFQEEFYAFFQEDLNTIDITKENFQSTLKIFKVYYSILRAFRDSSNIVEVIDDNLNLLKEKVLTLRGKEFTNSFKWTKKGFIELKESIEQLIK
jgi:hypothetical protein